MQNEIERAVLDYENGTLTRRQLIGRLAALTLAASAAGSKATAQTQSTFRANGINHVALNTPDIALSRDFYVKHLGMKVSRESETSCFLTCDDNFLALFRSQNAGLNHYCFSIDDYDVAKAEESLKSENLNPRREGNRIYFNDPHGITVQLAAGEHRP